MQLQCLLYFYYKAQYITVILTHLGSSSLKSIKLVTSKGLKNIGYSGVQIIMLKICTIHISVSKVDLILSYTDP